jgi:hypothetical protein
MKAEERERLETNALADRLGHWVDRLKAGDITLYRWIGVAVLVVLAVVVWRYVATSKATVASAQWFQLEHETSLTALDEFAKAYPNTTAGKIARLHEARVWLGPDGIAALQIKDADRRKKAIESIEKARDALGKLADEFKDDLVLRVQCLTGVAKAEEALIGIPKDGKTDEFRGSPEQAAAAYEAAAAAAAGTPLADDLKAYAQRVRDKKTEVVLVHGQLNNLMTPPKAPSLDPLPPKDGLPTPSVPGIPGGPNPVPPTPPMPTPIQPIPLPPTGLEPKAPAPPPTAKTPDPKAPANPTPPAKGPEAKASDPKAAPPPTAKGPEPKAPAPPPAPSKK